MCQGLCWHFIFIASSNPSATLWGRCYYEHFSEEETEAYSDWWHISKCPREISGSSDLIQESHIITLLVVFQSFSCVRLIVTPWTTAGQASLSLPSSRVCSNSCPSSLKWVIPSNHLILCCPLFLLPSILPRIRDFSNESALCIRWPEYWSFSISPSNEYSGLIFFRIDWFDVLAVQGSLKSLLQHCSSKASILQCLAFFLALSYYGWS